MSKFCQNCGSVINEGAKFCDNCGTPVPQQAPVQQSVPQGQPTGQYVPMGQAQQVPQGATINSFYGTPAIPPGFSDKVNDPEILEAIKKNRKAAGIFGLFIVPLPFIGFTIYSFVSDSMEPKQGMLYGAIVSAIFLLFALFSRLKQRASNTYEGVVVDKKQRERSDSDSDSGRSNYYTEYITVVKTTDGKKKKIRETSNGVVVAYNYLPVGARFKYHPQFAFPYELYDKSNAPYIGCVACGTHNSIMDDRCSKCNAPLLK